MEYHWQKKIQGIKAFCEELESMKSEKADGLILDQILSHGKAGAANGVMKLQNGKQYAFSDFYVFQGAKEIKVKSVTSYCIEI